MRRKHPNLRMSLRGVRRQAATRQSHDGCAVLDYSEKLTEPTRLVLLTFCSFRGLILLCGPPQAADVFALRPGAVLFE